jgi:hypothetical protein
MKNGIKPFYGKETYMEMVYDQWNSKTKNLTSLNLSQITTPFKNNTNNISNNAFYITTFIW